MRSLLSILMIASFSLVLVNSCSTENVDPVSCDDGIRNGNETGVDCGGPDCAPCPACDDGVQNGDETGVDCGGTCDPCPTCSDGQQNGNETGVDCGGACDACPTCSDGQQNGDETGVDCGGPDCPECPLTDIDGNTYTTVVVGTQEWMAGNLRTARYQNGDVIPNVTDISEWQNLTTGAFSWYDNNNQNQMPYGKLYNWYAVTDVRNICPTGWHVPTDEDWTTLSDFLGGAGSAGGKMKATGTIQAGTGLWDEPNTGATNESGFAGLPGGFRDLDGQFYDFGGWGYWWSTTEFTQASFAWIRYLSHNEAELSSTTDWKSNGLAVRCLKD